MPAGNCSETSVHPSTPCRHEDLNSQSPVMDRLTVSQCGLRASLSCCRCAVNQSTCGPPGEGRCPIHQVYERTSGNLLPGPRCECPRGCRDGHMARVISFEQMLNIQSQPSIGYQPSLMWPGWDQCVNSGDAGAQSYKACGCTMNPLVASLRLSRDDTPLTGVEAAVYREYTKRRVSLESPLRACWYSREK